MENTEHFKHSILNKKSKFVFKLNSKYFTRHIGWKISVGILNENNCKDVKTTFFFF